MNNIDKLKDSEFIKKRSDDIIENYKDKAGVNKLRVFTTDGGRKINKNTTPSWLKNGESWENPVSGKKWRRTKEGLLISGRSDRKNEFSPKICPKCHSYLKSHNDINIRLQTGKCIRCHSDAELDAIIEGKEYEPPQWKSDILIKDSMGKVVMNIDEYHQQYGDQMTFMFLNQLVTEIDERREKGENVNELIYENALNRRNKLKKKIKEQIESMNDTVEAMIESGEISEDLNEEDMEKVINKINKNKDAQK